MQRTTLAWVLGSLAAVSVGCTEVDPSTEAAEATAKPKTPSIAGIWTGLATAQPTSPSGLDHDTTLWIDCGEATGNVTYDYLVPAFSCDSELTRTSVSGSISIYADDSQTFGCVDGVVTLLRGGLTGPNAGKLRLTWSYPDGTIDTRGWLTQVASANCPIIP